MQLWLVIARFHGAVGPELILRRQPFTTDDDHRAIRLGQHLLDAQRHAISGYLHRGDQHPGLLQADEANARHVA